MSTNPINATGSASSSTPQPDADSNTVLPRDQPQRQPAIHNTSSSSTNAGQPPVRGGDKPDGNDQVPPLLSPLSRAALNLAPSRLQRSVDNPAPSSPMPAPSTPSAPLAAAASPYSPYGRPLLPGATRAELEQLLGAHDTSTLPNLTSLSTSSHQDEQNMARLGTALQQNLTGYPPEVQQFEQQVNHMQPLLTALPQPEYEAYAGALATLDVAFRDARAPADRQRVDQQLSLLGTALLERVNTASNDPVERALSVFNRPVGAGYLTGLANQQELSALRRLRQGFVIAATPAVRERYFTLAAELKHTLQHKIAKAIDQHTAQEAGKWAEANAEVDRIVHEADALTNAPGKRYELIGRQLYSTNPGTGRDDLADRRLLAFTQRMRDDSALHDKLVKWTVEAGRKLNVYGVDAPKSYLDILKQLPSSGPDYVRDLADRYNAVLHDSSYKDASITPRARGEKLAEQIFEGATRFLLGMTPFAPLTAAFDPHSLLSANTRLGIDLASGLLGLVAGEGATAFTERLAAKSATRVLKAPPEGYAPEHPVATGDRSPTLPPAPSGQPGSVGAQATQAAASPAAQGLSVDTAAAEASQRITGTKARLPDDYAVQPAPGALKPATGQPGIFTDDKGRYYLDSGGKTYPARFDRDNNTWRVYQADNPYRPQYPVRTDAQGGWEVHNDVGLKGGMNPDNAPALAPPQEQPFEERFQVSNASGTPLSAEMLQTLNPPAWHSDADALLDDIAFNGRYRAAFDNLPDSQQEALRNWTYLDLSETYSTGSDYEDVNFDLNRQLRDRSYETDTASRAHALQAALTHLPRPDQDSRLLRVAEVPADYASKFAPGDYVTNSPAFMSASSESEYTNATLADSEYAAAPGGAFALYDIQSKSATPFVYRVTTLASGEHEWIFRPNTVFRIDEIAAATPQDGAVTPRIGLRLTEVPVDTPIFAKNIYTGEQELVNPSGTTPVYTTLQPTRTPPAQPSPPNPDLPPLPTHGATNQPGPATT
ncbi:hypothetical protein [Paraburkholderia phenazinium]|uniref:Uncharacterized protein n=1 Tax=Paraburkholderia phenazinium TaxID=60549 RepID=A0A1N6KFP8_9BURK|nr:hypothetical protein [Paraburkholderia phenazinium]SIO55385.1 hypothetical protein SAMN05444165_3551 [Paraburkholderia phenazinium]